MADLLDEFDADFTPTPLPGANMTPEELSAAWTAARPSYRAPRDTNDMVLIDIAQQSCGDWKLYQDADGSYYTEYASVGD